MGAKLRVQGQVDTNEETLQKLIEKAGEVGIINIAAGKSGISEHIVKDAIEATEIVNQYFKNQTFVSSS